MSPPLWHQGWYAKAQHLPSPNFGPRPEGAVCDTVILHSISLPPGEYGGSAIAQLFTNQLDFDAHPYFQQIRGLEVSAHFVITRAGHLQQFVSIDDRAWHAGRSSWRGRDNCNDYAVGIELEGLEGDVFEAAQYQTLSTLLRALSEVWTLQQVVGHEHVAPGRKADPGPGFDWAHLQETTGWSASLFPISQAKNLIN